MHMSRIAASTHMLEFHSGMSDSVVQEEKCRLKLLSMNQGDPSSPKWTRIELHPFSDEFSNIN